MDSLKIATTMLYTSKQFFDPDQETPRAILSSVLEQNIHRRAHIITLPSKTDT